MRLLHNSVFSCSFPVWRGSQDCRAVLRRHGDCALGRPGGEGRRIGPTQNSRNGVIIFAGLKRWLLRQRTARISEFAGCYCNARVVQAPGFSPRWRRIWLFFVPATAISTAGVQCCTILETVAAYRATGSPARRGSCRSPSPTVAPRIGRSRIPAGPTSDEGGMPGFGTYAQGLSKRRGLVRE